MGNLAINNTVINAYNKIKNLNIESETEKYNSSIINNFQQELKSAEQNYNSGEIKSSVGQSSIGLSLNKLPASIITNLSSTTGKLDEVVSAALTGNVSVAEVTSTLMHAETMIKEIVSIRDKMLSSFQEILKMNI